MLVLPSVILLLPDILQYPYDILQKQSAVTRAAAAAAAQQSIRCWVLGEVILRKVIL